MNSGFTPSGGGRNLTDLRPSSPGQLALVGVALWLVGVLLSPLGFLSAVGILLVIVAGLTLLIRPRAREMYWRGRRLDIGGEPGMGERIYQAIYRR